TLARIIDMILVGVVVWLLTWPFGVSEYNVDTDRINVGNSFWQSLVAAVLYIAYDTLLTARMGQTLGKKWLKMRVANLDNGATPSTQTSLVRAAVLWLPFAFCCACVWTVIAGGWSYFDRPYKQGLHDKAAKTVVVSTGGRGGRSGGRPLAHGLAGRGAGRGPPGGRARGVSGRGPDRYRARPVLRTGERDGHGHQQADGG